MAGAYLLDRNGPRAKGWEDPAFSAALNEFDMDFLMGFLADHYLGIQSSAPFFCPRGLDDGSEDMEGVVATAS